MAEARKVQRNFKPWDKVEERLVFAETNYGMLGTELINEVLDKHLKAHIESKAKKLREALSVPIP